MDEGRERGFVGREELWLGRKLVGGGRLNIRAGAWEGGGHGCLALYERYGFWTLLSRDAIVVGDDSLDLKCTWFEGQVDGWLGHSYWEERLIRSVKLVCCPQNA